MRKMLELKRGDTVDSLRKKIRDRTKAIRRSRRNNDSLRRRIFKHR